MCEPTCTPHAHVCMYSSNGCMCRMDESFHETYQKMVWRLNRWSNPSKVL